MRLANLEGRLTLLKDRGAVDVEAVSGGAFSSDPQAIYARWQEFTDWHALNTQTLGDASAVRADQARFLAPVPAPRQVFAVGLNYRDHAAEAGMQSPVADPLVFTKFPSSVVGPVDVVELPSEFVDFETELVVAMGRRAHRVRRADAWSFVAGLTLGQDLSDRVVQFRGPTPQFSLGKSYPGFSPTGPVLVTPDEFADPDDIALGCTLDGQQMQKSRTDKLIFSIPHLVEAISAIVPLLPGDLIFTGTPAGVGWTRDPKVLLKPGSHLVSSADVIGELTTTFSAR